MTYPVPAYPYEGGCCVHADCGGCKCTPTFSCRCCLRNVPTPNAYRGSTQ